jgi:putative peptidoglycan lipid II flippase
MFLQMLAPCAGSVVARIGEIVERAAASTLAPGSVAALTLARKLVDLPLLIISLAAATVLFTYFAELNHAGDRREVARLMDTGMRIMVLIFLPISILTCLLSKPIVTIVYQRGEFDAHAALQVSRALFWLAPSMMFLALEMLLMRHFFSRLDVWTPTLIGMGCVGARIGLLWLFVQRWDILGVALAITLSRIVKVAVLFLVMRRWREPSPLSRTVADSAKIAAAACAAGVAGLAVLLLMKGSSTHSLLGEVRDVLSVGFAGVAAYGAAILLLWRGNLRQAILPAANVSLTSAAQFATEENRP